MAAVDQFMGSLPNGLQTLVGERGARLSGGQRQRISLARAILRPAPILVLDEATSALDLELEQKVIGNLAHSSKSRTVFAITHRLSLAEIADRVLVLKEGTLAQEGKPEDLAVQVDLSQLALADVHIRPCKYDHLRRRSECPLRFKVSCRNPNGRRDSFAGSS